MEKERSGYPSWIPLILHELQTELSTIDVEAVMTLDCLKKPSAKRMKEAERSLLAIRTKIREMGTVIRTAFHELSDDADGAESAEGAEASTMIEVASFLRDAVRGWVQDPRTVISLKVLKSEDSTEDSTEEQTESQTEVLLEDSSEVRSEDAPEDSPEVRHQHRLEQGLGHGLENRPENGSENGSDKRLVNSMEDSPDESALHEPGEVYINPQGPPGMPGKIQIPVPASTLKLVLDVLISNAVRYRKGDIAEVQLVAHVSPKTLRITCKDYGMGIRAEDLPKIGSAPFRGANTGHTDGSGVALHFVFGLLERVGGEVKMDAKEGEFTEICVTMPVGRNTKHNGR